jgi:hypothetical protein
MKEQMVTALKSLVAGTVPVGFFVHLDIIQEHMRDVLPIATTSLMFLGHSKINFLLSRRLLEQRDTIVIVFGR